MHCMGPRCPRLVIFQATWHVYFPVRNIQISFVYYCRHLNGGSRGLKVMGEEVTSAEGSKQRITAQLNGAVKALQAAHVKNRTKVAYR